MNMSDKIFIAGHQGLAGSAIFRALQKEGYTNLVTKTHEELDLLDTASVRKFFQIERPAYVFMAAAKVGGIQANTERPAEFIYENLVMQSNVIHEAHLSGVKKMCFLGCSCAYPKLASQPIHEDSLLTGALESTSAAYSVAKIAGITLCQAYRTQYGARFMSVMPTNLYGPHDDFDPMNSHVIPGLIRKFHDARRTGAKEITLWGSGSAQREFLFADDLGGACVFLMQTYDDAGLINIGTGQDVTIRELAERLKAIIGFEGEILWDISKPDGTPRKVLDVSKIQTLGWKHTVPLEQGLRDTYEWYCKNVV